MLKRLVGLSGGSGVYVDIELFLKGSPFPPNKVSEELKELARQKLGAKV